MIRLAGNFLTALVALAHLGFLALEMFFWNHPVGQKLFAMTPEFAAESATLAMNQGLYNGFLAAGLAWGLAANRRDIKLFFLGCVIVAGIFGGLTAKGTILIIQALPGALAFLLIIAARPEMRDKVR